MDTTGTGVALGVTQANSNNLACENGHRNPSCVTPKIFCTDLMLSICTELLFHAISAAAKPS